MLTESLAPYMLWAKTRTPAAIDLAGSNLLSCTVDDLPGAHDALQLTAPNDNGFAPLLDAIAAHAGVARDRIITATGCSGANFHAIAALVGHGDEVLIEQPGYDPLAGVCRLLGATVRWIPRDPVQGFALDLDAVADAITPRTRLIIVTTPHNPSGVCLDHETLRALGTLADRVGAHVLVDEVYLDAVRLADPDRGLTSAWHLDGPFIVTTSLTKSYGLNGLRCGWAVAPSPAIADRLWRVRDLVEAVGSQPSDRLSALAFTQMPHLRARTRAIVSANLALARDFVASQPRLQLAEPPRATVMFPRLDAGADTRPFVDHVAEAFGVAVAAGAWFAAPGHVRISLAGATSALSAGLDRLAQALRQ
jgi:aspartate/methionine/tyrosine aminotransferase